MGGPVTNSLTRSSPLSEKSLSTTIRWSGRRVCAAIASSDFASSSGRRCVTSTAHTRLTGGSSAAHLGDDFGDVPRRVIALVRADHVLDLAHHLDRPVVDPDRRLAQSGQKIGGVAGENGKARAPAGVLQTRLGLLPELPVHGG